MKYFHNNKCYIHEGRALLELLGITPDWPVVFSGSSSFDFFTLLIYFHSQMISDFVPLDQYFRVI